MILVFDFYKDLYFNYLSLIFSESNQALGVTRSHSESLLTRIRKTIIRSQSSQEVHDASSSSSSLTSGPDDIGDSSSSLDSINSSSSSYSESNERFYKTSNKE